LALAAGGRRAAARLEHRIDELEHGALVGGWELRDAAQPIEDSG
jgi:hypothetical protein